jgi:hypothetical protein
MFIKQYRITLPADYDMNIVRERVATRGASFDSFAGLGLKCFVIREKGKFGADSNQYAPIYLWPQVDAMWGFLAGPAFAGIKQAFGVPPIETWAGYAYARSAHLTDPASIASVTRVERLLDPDTDLAGGRQQERDAAAAAVERIPGLLARAVGVDPRSWRIVTFDYWAHTQAELPVGLHSYEVLHVSAPEFDALR